nr:MAG TPA: hypothetical protein [Caudoviricetes sp.]
MPSEELSDDIFLHGRSPPPFSRRGCQGCRFF